MTITLTPKQEELINQKVAQGDFADASEVINAALSLFLEQQEDALSLEQLKLELERADAQFARGEYRNVNKAAIPALFEEIKLCGDQRVRGVKTGLLHEPCRHF